MNQHQILLDMLTKKENMPSTLTPLQQWLEKISDPKNQPAKILCHKGPREILRLPAAKRKSESKPDSAGYAHQEGEHAINFMMEIVQDGCLFFLDVLMKISDPKNQPAKILCHKGPREILRLPAGKRKPTPDPAGYAHQEGHQHAISFNTVTALTRSKHHQEGHQHAISFNTVTALTRSCSSKAEQQPSVIDSIFTVGSPGFSTVVILDQELLCSLHRRVPGFESSKFDQVLKYE
ncbi:hypothetical protein QE152_g5779 [Popillia japonica]|uniref:Uncharacterized protein n=1 Tax=Popillia japonica TaxID=7064 RepID=A0AAW1MKN8_POPJA